MTLIMDLNAVRLLVRVAETRSFTRAAGDLGLTQSGLSRAISRLENELGVRLLQRNTRSVSLTPDGQLLYERSAPLLAELAEAEKLMLDRRGSPSGLLKISTPSLFGRKVVMPVIGELTLRYPKREMARESPDWVSPRSPAARVKLRVSATRTSRRTAFRSMIKVITERVKALFIIYRA